MPARVASRRVVLGLLLLGCTEPAPSCDVVIAKLWRSRDIDPYFSAVPLDQAVRQCRGGVDADTRRCVVSRPMREIAECPGVEGLAVDQGWRSGLYCFEAEGVGASRCERSNRECEHYRRIASRNRGAPGRCTEATRAWAVVDSGRSMMLSPTESGCQAVRAVLLDRKAVGADSVCAAVDFATVVRTGRPVVIAAPESQ